MTKCEVLGDNFHLEDDEMDVDFEFDNETGMVEIYVADEQRQKDWLNKINSRPSRKGK